jgi:enamine deaminase RidA (YjgF/YER057c/UK114 family)
MNAQTEEDPSMHRVTARSGSPYEDRFGFSRAMRVGDRVHVAGTAPVWPDGSCPDDPEVQSRRCFEIAAKALAEVGASLEDVVRTRMYVTDAGIGDAVGRAHAEALGQVRPAATMVVVAALLDPRWLVEIELDAIVADRGPGSGGGQVPSDTGAPH